MQKLTLGKSFRHKIQRLAALIKQSATKPKLIPLRRPPKLRLVFSADQVYIDNIDLRPNDFAFASQVAPGT
jgi:hypothetical protein